MAKNLQLSSNNEYIEGESGLLIEMPNRNKLMENSQTIQLATENGSIIHAIEQDSQEEQKVQNAISDQNRHNAVIIEKANNSSSPLEQTQASLENQERFKLSEQMKVERDEESLAQNREKDLMKQINENS